jgi:hypothetical protein
MEQPARVVHFSATFAQIKPFARHVQELIFGMEQLAACLISGLMERFVRIA